MKSMHSKKKNFALDLIYQSLQLFACVLCTETHKNVFSQSKHFIALPTYNLIGTIAFLSILTYPQKAFPQEMIYVDFIESFNEIPSTNNTSLPIINKSNRLKSTFSISFKIEHDNNVPDSVVKCLAVSSDIWRSCLNMNSNHAINLQLAWEDLPHDEDVKISVLYVKDPYSQDYIPASLFHSLRPDTPNEGTCDAKITINKNVEWDCGYNIENNIGVRNLNYVMLRSIAIALGYGTSLSLSNLSTGAIVKFPFSQGHSLFDNLLISDNGIQLKDLTNTGRTQNSEIIKFSTGVYGEVHINGICNGNDSISKYKMYTPESYEKNKSLIYLDNEQSLMHYSLDKTTKKFQIDSITANVLNKIGWDVVLPTNYFKIIGNNIPESGVTSAYTPHTFYIEGDGKNNLSNAKWYFYLPSINGNEILEKSAEGCLSFNIDAISEPDNFAINVNGDIYGRIIFTGMLNGKTIYSQYNVTLELKPSISDVKIVKRKNDGFDSYNAVCKVDYKGADYLYVTLEEEYGSTLRSQFVREPYLAHFVCSDIASPYYAWIDITVENQYGRDVYTIELPPFNNQENQSHNASDSINNAFEDNVFSEIRIYNKNGNYLKTISNLSEIQSLPPGMYVLEYYKENEIVKITKLIK